jgi:hypothetical protein
VVGRSALPLANPVVMFVSKPYEQTIYKILLNFFS